jgi:protein-L-isoaspartate(D-aspartate) O-methyltransferase
MPQALSAREHMIVSQLMTGIVLEPRILEAVNAVDRTHFVPDIYRGSAYLDGEVPLGEERYLLEPLTFARMLQLAEISYGDTVLDVACGYGYSAAVISRLASRVIGLESRDTLAHAAIGKLAEAGAENVMLVYQALWGGYRPLAPYDAIFIEGCTEYIPQAFRDQLKEGGRLVTIENVRGAYEGRRQGKLVVYRKKGGILYRREEFDAAAMPIPELRRTEHFVF